MCFKFKWSLSLCEEGYSLTPGVQQVEKSLTAVCSHCHAAESSVIYSVIGA